MQIVRNSALFWAASAIAIWLIVSFGFSVASVVLLLFSMGLLLTSLIKNRSQLAEKYIQKAQKINAKQMANADDFGKVAWLLGLTLASIAVNFALLSVENEYASRIEQLLLPLIGKLGVIALWSATAVWVLALGIEFSLGYFFARKRSKKEG